MKAETNEKLKKGQFRRNAFIITIILLIMICLLTWLILRNTSTGEETITQVSLTNSEIQTLADSGYSVNVFKYEEYINYAETKAYYYEVTESGKYYVCYKTYSGSTLNYLYSSNYYLMTEKGDNIFFFENVTGSSAKSSATAIELEAGTTYYFHRYYEIYEQNVPVEEDEDYTHSTFYLIPESIATNSMKAENISDEYIMSIGYYDDYYQMLPLSGAEFILSKIETIYNQETEENEEVTYYAIFVEEEIYDSDTGEMTSELVLLEWTEDKSEATILETNDDGYIFFDGIEGGTYYLIEAKAPNGYTKLENPVEIEVNEDDGTIYVQNEAKDESGLELEVSKIDENGVALEGVVFGIFDSEGNIIETYETDEDGNFTAYLDLGEYTVKEISTIYGYNLNGEEYEILVNDDGIFLKE